MSVHVLHIGRTLFPAKQDRSFEGLPWRSLARELYRHFCGARY